MSELDVGSRSGRGGKVIPRVDTVRIVLAEDHLIVREGLRLLLERVPDFRVVGEAANGLEALQLVESERPDVLVIDLMMPQLNGMATTQQVTRRFPETRVVVLSMHQSEPYVRDALRYGASAYVPKGSPGAELVRAVRQVCAGKSYLSGPLSEHAVESYVSAARLLDDDPYDTLTAREKEVLQLAAEGHTNPEIGMRLFISPRTVEAHRINLMRKLSLRTPTDLVRYALRRRILSID